MHGVDERRLRTRVAGAALAVLVAACSRTPGPVTADPYRAEIERFREGRQAKLTSDTGWLTIAGLFFLTKPEMSFGSDPLNDIVLPAGAPARAGTFEVLDKAVSVKAAPGEHFLLAGKPETKAELKSDGQGAPDRIMLGDLTLWVHESGERLAIRLRDKNNHLRKDFTGMKWFPVNEAYRVEARFEPYDKPRLVQVPNLLGDIDTMPSPGVVRFSIGGQELRMAVVTENDTEFWFIFRDLTSGRETYPAARFLYTSRPLDGRLTLDFNKAENPPCAFNPYATCPLPPEENKLRVRIEAGEKNYDAH